jgi:PAS domain S-box-containing protein
MPSIRIPLALRKALRPPDVDGNESPPGPAVGARKPALTYDDPRIHAFLRVNFGVLYDWDIPTGAIYFSEQLDEMLGLRPGGFPRSLEGWLAWVHPQDHDAVCDELWRCITEGEPLRAEYRLRKADGTYIAVDDQGVTLHDSKGRPTNLIGAIRDVTQARAVERALRRADELRHVLFQIGSPAMQVDASGAYVDATPTALQFFERTADEMLAANARDDFPPEALGCLSTEAAVSDTGMQVKVDCVVNGMVKSLVLAIIPCSLGDERGFFLVGTDISALTALQRELASSEQALRQQTTILDERNTALKVLLEQREHDREELQARMIANIGQLIEPTLDRLSRALSHRPEQLDIEALRTNLRQITGPLAQNLNGGRHPLTRRETEVANLVCLGKTSAEIAQALHISTSSVAFHRSNIRRKLDIPKRGHHLATHLAGLGRD